MRNKLINKNSEPFFFCLAITILGILIFSSYIPIWDYPDIIPRNKRIFQELNADKQKFLVYLSSYLNLIMPDLTIVKNCSFDNYSECLHLNNELIWNRLHINFLLLLISIITISTILFFIKIFNKNFMIENDLYLKSYFLAISFPGTIYLITNPIYESLFIYLSIFFILLYNSYLKFLILFLCYLIDNSDTYVLLYFLLVERTFYLISKYNINYYLYITIIFLLITALINTDLLHFIKLFFETDKINQILDNINNKGEYLNSTLILRVFITFKSFLIMTPNYFYAPIFTIFILCTITFLLINNLKFFNLGSFKEISFNQHLLFSSLITQISLVFMLPTHTHGKYFVFMIPIIFIFLMNKYSFSSLIKFNLIGLFMVVIDLILFFGIK